MMAHLLAEIRTGEEILKEEMLDKMGTTKK
jgi:hypothetical protein